MSLLDIKNITWPLTHSETPSAPSTSFYSFYLSCLAWIQKKKNVNKPPSPYLTCLTSSYFDQHYHSLSAQFSLFIFIFCTSFTPRLAYKKKINKPSWPCLTRGNQQLFYPNSLTPWVPITIVYLSFYLSSPPALVSKKINNELSPLSPVAGQSFTSYCPSHPQLKKHLCLLYHRMHLPCIACYSFYLSILSILYFAIYRLPPNSLLLCP